MKLGEFREWTKDLPDNSELVFWDGGDAVSWYEANPEQIIPATPIHPDPVCVLDMGQQVELQFDLAIRTGIDDGC